MNSRETFDQSSFDETVLNGSPQQIALLARRALSASEAEQDTLSPRFAPSLIDAYKKARQEGDIESAYTFALSLRNVDASAESGSLFMDAARTLGLADLDKANAAYDEKQYRRAADKSIWAVLRLREAADEGAQDLEPHLRSAVTINIWSTGQYYVSLEYTNDFEDHLIATATDEQIDEIKREIVAARKQLYNRASQNAETTDDDRNRLYWLEASEHARVMQKYDTTGVNHSLLIQLPAMRAYNAAIASKEFSEARHIVDTNLTFLKEARREELYTQAANQEIETFLTHTADSQNSPGKRPSPDEYLGAASLAFDIGKLTTGQKFIRHAADQCAPDEYDWLLGEIANIFDRNNQQEMFVSELATIYDKTVQKLESADMFTVYSWAQAVRECIDFVYSEFFESPPFVTISYTELKSAAVDKLNAAYVVNPVDHEWMLDEIKDIESW